MEKIQTQDVAIPRLGFGTFPLSQSNMPESRRRGASYSVKNCKIGYVTNDPGFTRSSASKEAVWCGTATKWPSQILKPTGARA
jgi:hypothetical protein